MLNQTKTNVFGRFFSTRPCKQHNTSGHAQPLAASLFGSTGLKSSWHTKPAHKTHCNGIWVTNTSAYWP
ncbi:MAG: hypothetical protein EAY75_05780 [Bacteroidetes bacterium]|nr:MAG: hypothetical protein EAY75_05780 [Bacteroidota bacterium]